MNNTLAKTNNGLRGINPFFSEAEMSGSSMFDLIFGGLPLSWGTKETGDTVRFHSEGELISIEFDLPGVLKKDLEVTLGPAREGHYLQVKAKRSVLSSSGNREETITKGTTLKGINDKTVKTKLENGVLTVTAKKLNYTEIPGVRTIKVE